MSASTSKRKRATPSHPLPSTSQSIVINSLLECYDFLATNEYSEKTIGIQTFLTRKSVGDINFSDIIDDSEKRNRQGQNTNFVAILEDKRHNLPEIDASVEKCLMLNRLITFIEENQSRFTSIISDIRLDMQYKMTDSQNGQNTNDFRKREQDFNLRKHAQEIRRLFYHSHDELKQPQNLICLQNRTTEQLIYITNQISRDSKSRSTYSTELETIFRTSFMIVAQPHAGVNPVTIYERRGPGEYTAKISVIIISLLHDFMEAHPNLIELYDIEPSLCPASPFYKLEEPRSLPWKTCQLQAAPGGKSRTFHYAELSAITIEQSSKTDTRVRFAQSLHSFKFAIKLQLNIADNKHPPVYQVPLESLQFSIGGHNNQIPQLLTRVLLDDIRRFSKIQPIDVKIIQNFIQRYFIHRTGVQPNECVNIYLEQELTKATNQRSNYQSLEDIYMDFLVNFVHQVEFMAKHPVLVMFHSDGLFLGICNSERAAEAIVQSSISGSPLIGLRFNSIRIDYNAISASSMNGRTIKTPPCAIRVDIYNDRTKKLQNRTFDSTILANDISKFVSAAQSENASRIRILSSFDDRANGKTYSSFIQFANYYHKRLQEISKNDEKYKPVTDLVENANDGNTDEDGCDIQSQNTLDLFPFSPNSFASWPPETPNTMDNELSSDATSVHEYVTIPYETSSSSIASPQNILPLPDRSQQQQQPPPQQNSYVNSQELMLKYILSQPQLAEQVMRQYGIQTAPTPMVPSPQVLQQPQMLYPTQPVPYQQQVPTQPVPYQQQILTQPVPYQQQVPTQIIQQRQPSLAPIYPQQQQPQMYQQPQMQFQSPISPQQAYFPQQQQQQQQPVWQLQQQQRTSPSVIHYRPNNANQPSSTQQGQFFTSNGTDNMPQQFLDQIHILNLTDENLNQPITNSMQQQITTDQTSITYTDQEIQQMIDSLTNSTFPEIIN